MDGMKHWHGMARTRWPLRWQRWSVAGRMRSVDTGVDASRASGGCACSCCGLAGRFDGEGCVWDWAGSESVQTRRETRPATRRWQDLEGQGGVCQGRQLLGPHDAALWLFLGVQLCRAELLAAARTCGFRQSLHCRNRRMKGRRTYGSQCHVFGVGSGKSRSARTL